MKESLLSRNWIDETILTRSRSDERILRWV